MYFVYCITNLINNKIYIGKARNINQRWSQHKSCANKNKGNSVLYKAIRKYGIDNFTISILEELEDEETCYKKESEWIIKLNSTNREIGYNMGFGGEGNRGKYITEETRKKHSIRSKRNYSLEVAERLRKAKFTDEARKNSSLASIGSKNARAKLTEEIVIQIRNLYESKKYTQLELAALFNAPPTTINHVIKRYT